MDKKSIIRNFSKAAHCYDRYADVQRRAAYELLSRFPANGFRNILELGCGTGIFTRLLEERFGSIPLTAVDISTEMIKVAKDRLRGKGVEFIVADAEEDLPALQFDLITSNACFQWFTDLAAAFGKYKDGLKKNGLLLFSMFGPETFWELNEVLRSFSNESLVVASRFVAEERLKGLLEKNFKDVSVDEIRYRERFERLDEFLVKIRRTGAAGAGPQAKNFFSRRRLKELQRVFLDRFGCIQTTYQVFFCRGSKP